jgi:hypothetical protein
MALAGDGKQAIGTPPCIWGGGVRLLYYCYSNILLFVNYRNRHDINNNNIYSNHHHHINNTKEVVGYSLCRRGMELWDCLVWESREADI